MSADREQDSSHRSWHYVSEQSLEEAARNNPLYRPDATAAQLSLDSNIVADYSLPELDDCIDRGNSLPYSGTSPVLPEVARLSLSKDDSALESRSSVEDNPEKLSTNVKSMWNNFKNGEQRFNILRREDFRHPVLAGFTLGLKSDFKYETPIWLLGNYYHPSKAGLTKLPCAYMCIDLYSSAST